VQNNQKQLPVVILKPNHSLCGEFLQRYVCYVSNLTRGSTNHKNKFIVFHREIASTRALGTIEA